MKKLMFCLMILIMLSFVAGQGIQEYYEIDLNYNQGEFELINLDVEISDIELKNYFGFYIAEVLDYSGEILNLTFFEIPNKILYDEVDENGTIVSGGEAELEEVNFTTYIPYYSNAKEIVIYDENLTEKLVIDVSMYSEIEEGVSLEGEEDEEGVEEGVTDRESRDSPKEVKDYWWILLIILIILIFIFVILLRKKKPKKRVQYRR